MLPILKEKNMHAWELGLFDEELKAYPNMIRCPDCAKKQSTCGHEEQTKINLFLQESTELRNHLENEATKRKVEKAQSSQTDMKRQKLVRKKREKDSQLLSRFLKEEYDVGADQSEDE